MFGSIAYHNARRQWWALFLTCAPLSAGAINRVGLVAAVALMAFAFTASALLIALGHLLIFYYRTVDLPKRRAHILSLRPQEQALEIYDQFNRW